MENKEFAEKYPLWWKNVKYYLFAFPSFYLMETAFSRVNQLQTKTCNKLNITKKGDLRMALTKLSQASRHLHQNTHSNDHIECFNITVIIRME